MNFFDYIISFLCCNKFDHKQEEMLEIVTPPIAKKTNNTNSNSKTKPENSVISSNENTLYELLLDSSSDSDLDEANPNDYSLVVTNNTTFNQQQLLPIDNTPNILFQIDEVNENSSNQSVNSVSNRYYSPNLRFVGNPQVSAKYKSKTKY